MFAKIAFFCAAPRSCQCLCTSRQHWSQYLIQTTRWPDEWTTSLTDMIPCHRQDHTHTQRTRNRCQRPSSSSHCQSLCRPVAPVVNHIAPSCPVAVRRRRRPSSFGAGALGLGHGAALGLGYGAGAPIGLKVLDSAMEPPLCGYGAGIYGAELAKAIY
ncbi:hypothetical protein CEXT_262051 [Caerostris extrusa]|uniref:Uncharacterized protein n=1 Tax=Caerostris extrusa TaxID=172846 RepID=A0AAV4RQY9_CAEEX|nr:hypothetical protein CEXT_262051 [Caerostris extrusa]